MFLSAGYARKATPGRAAVDQCVVGVATGARWSTFNIAVTASTTGAATSSAKPARGKSKSADVTERTCLLTYLLTTGGVDSLKLMCVSLKDVQ